MDPKEHIDEKVLISLGGFNKWLKDFIYSLPRNKVYELVRLSDQEAFNYIAPVLDGERELSSSTEPLDVEQIRQQLEYAKQKYCKSDFVDGDDVIVQRVVEKKKRTYIENCLAQLGKILSSLLDSL